MARWIDADSTTRFFQYILPDARKRLAQWPAYKEEFQARFREVHAAHKADLQSRKWRRRTRKMIEEWKDICAEEERLRAIVARGDRARRAA